MSCAGRRGRNSAQVASPPATTTASAMTTSGTTPMLRPFSITAANWWLIARVTGRTCRSVPPGTAGRCNTSARSCATTVAGSSRSRTRSVTAVSGRTTRRWATTGSGRAAGGSGRAAGGAVAAGFESARRSVTAGVDGSTRRSTTAAPMAVRWGVRTPQASAARQRVPPRLAWAVPHDVRPPAALARGARLPRQGAAGGAPRDARAALASAVPRGRAAAAGLAVPPAVRARAAPARVARLPPLAAVGATLRGTLGHSWLRRLHAAFRDWPGRVRVTFGHGRRHGLYSFLDRRLRAAIRGAFERHGSGSAAAKEVRARLGRARLRLDARGRRFEGTGRQVGDLDLGVRADEPIKGERLVRGRDCSPKESSTGRHRRSPSGHAAQLEPAVPR